MYELLKKLTTVSSVSGREGKIADAIEKFIAPYCDSVSRDVLGNVIACRHGSGQNPKKIMLSAHMDEIGFFVTYIEKNGYLRVASVGGIDYVASAFSEVISENGVRGVLAKDDGDKEKKKFTFDQFYIDIGAEDKRDAERKVRVGDYFVLVPHVAKLMHQRILGRPLDDRLGCCVLLTVAKQMAALERSSELYYVFTVQEEVGCRGSKTAAFGIGPDEAIVFDVTGTGDVPGADPMACKLGGGAAIKLKDASLICDAELAGALAETAKANRIRYQYEILTYGGTDTSSIQVAGCGCRAAALSVPTRYIHTGCEVCDLNDARACVDLTVAYLTK